jgi:negative regulator of flagellin synthesis FlgM
MRIDLTNTAASQIANEPAQSPVNGKNAAVAQPAAGEDRTTLTSDKASVSALVGVAMNSPEIREDKVASLQQAIANGTYELDPAKIAASMIDEHA